MKVRRSRTLPWPPVILAIMSLPQRTAQVTRPIASKTIINNVQVIKRRSLEGFFLGFLIFLGLTGLDSGSGVGSGACLGDDSGSLRSVESKSRA